jgi:hypothetical protein
MLKFNILEKTEFAVTPEFSIQREGFAAWKPDGYLSLSLCAYDHNVTGGSAISGNCTSSSLRGR